jgi:nitrile hydratase accessory protein
MSALPPALMPASTPDPGPPAEPVFAEPWQAQAFALAVELHRRGLFTWREWADALAAEIAAGGAAAASDADAASAPVQGDGAAAGVYYGQWLAALEKLVIAKGAGRGAELERTRRGWHRAAARTMHGEPIELRAVDLDPEARPPAAADAGRGGGLR